MHRLKFNPTSTCDKRIAASNLLCTNLANKAGMHWKLVIGYWLLVIGYRLLVIGNLGQCNSIPDAGPAQVDHK